LVNTQPFLSEAAEEVRLLVTRTVIPDVRDVADHLCDIADHLSYYTIDTTPGTVTHIPTDNNNEEN
jgi:hypothetical protein